MSEKLKTKLITQECILYEGDASSVVAPAVNGQLGILAKHAPLMAALDKGVLKISDNSSEKYFVVFGGFLQVKDNRVIVLADSARAADKINLHEAEEKLAALKNSLDATTGEGEPEKADELRKAMEEARINYRAARLAHK
jgi:F-type H+-transporting ATPase subunit epsilon